MGKRQERECIREIEGREKETERDWVRGTVGKDRDRHTQRHREIAT